MKTIIKELRLGKMATVALAMAICPMVSASKLPEFVSSVVKKVLPDSERKQVKYVQVGRYLVIKPAN